MDTLRFALLLLTGATLTHAGASFAQNNDRTQDGWQVTAGGGVAVRPEFPGSDSLELRPLPAFNITYGEHWFLNADGLGAYLLKRERGSLALSIGPDLTHRDESDADYLRGVGDVDRTGVARLKSSYQLGPVLATAAIATDIADQGHGTTAEFALQHHTELTQSFSLNYGVAARWIDDEYAESFFGVDALHSRRSGLPQYEAKSGIGDARLFVNAVYILNPRWILSTGAAAASLQGDAADSPIVEDDSYFTFDAAVLYRF